MKVAEENKWDTIVFNCMDSSIYTRKATKAKNVVDVVMNHLLELQYKGDVVFCCNTEECADVFRNELEERKRSGELSE